jgi:hypothetical protein
MGAVRIGLAGFIPEGVEALDDPVPEGKRRRKGRGAEGTGAFENRRRYFHSVFVFVLTLVIWSHVKSLWRWGCERVQG